MIGRLPVQLDHARRQLTRARRLAASIAGSTAPRSTSWPLRSTACSTARRLDRPASPGACSITRASSAAPRQLAGSTAPKMPKRPPVSLRGTQTPPGQLAGLLVAPRPIYGHAASSQPANRCSTGQLHSIAGASFPGLPARLPVRPAAHSISSRAPGATQPARLACSRCHRAGTPAASMSSRWPRLLDCRQLPRRPRQLPGSSGQQLTGPAHRAAPPGLDCGPRL